MPVERKMMLKHLAASLSLSLSGRLTLLFGQVSVEKAEEIFLPDTVRRTVSWACRWLLQCSFFASS